MSRRPLLRETRPCEQCGKAVTRLPKDFLAHVYCSHRCQGAALTRTETRRCEHCGVPVTRTPLKFTDERTFCSAQCAGFANSFPHPQPWPADYDDAVTTGAMLWTREDGSRAKHAIYPFGFDARAEIAEARHDAARWLMEHSKAPLLEWEHPEFALFGAANTEARAA